MASPRKPRQHQRFLTLDELSPTVHLAACFRWQGVLHRYRVPSHHLLLIESGKVTANSPTESFKAEAGDLICFRPADWNEYEVRDIARIYEAHLEFAPPPKQRLTPTLDEFGPLPLRIPLGTTFEEMRQVFEVFCMEIRQAGALHRLRLRAAVHEMLAIVVSVLRHDDKNFQHLDQWQRVRLRLDSDLAAGLSIQRLAQEMGLSRRYFSRVFRQRFGLTPKAYHVHARLQEATRLLRQSEKSVKAIAFEMGFNDPRVFSRLFKQHLGVLPSDVRLGAAPPPSDEPRGPSRLFPVNVHLLPPESARNWRAAYFPRRRKPGYEMTVPVKKN